MVCSAPTAAVASKLAAAARELGAVARLPAPSSASDKQGKSGMSPSGDQGEPWSVSRSWYLTAGNADWCL
jgi:hypothetical protein